MAALVMSAGISPHPVVDITGVILCCVVAYCVGFALAYWLGTSPFTSDGSTGSLFALFTLPGRYGPLLQKELLYFGRVLDIYIGVFLGWILGISNFYQQWLLANKAVAVVLIVLAANVVPMMAPFATDSRREVNRYSIFPVSETRMLTTKTLALAMISVFQIGPIYLSCAMCSGLRTEVLVVLSYTSTLLMYSAAGSFLMFSTTQHLGRFARPFRLRC